MPLIFISFSTSEVHSRPRDTQTNQKIAKLTHVFSKHQRTNFSGTALLIKTLKNRIFYTEIDRQSREERERGRMAVYPKPRGKDF